MKKQLHLLIFLSFLSGGMANAQTVYNFTIGEIHHATKGNGPGIRLPDGTVVKAEFVATTRSGVNQATPQKGVDMFETGNGKSSGLVVNWLGGNFDGETLTSYVGSKNPAKFTTIQANNAFGIERGFATDFGGSVGVRLFFNKPTKFTNFLFIDIDGKSQGGGFANKEWATAFGYRDDKYVPMTLTTSGADSNLGFQPDVPISNSQGWKAMLIDKLPLDAHKDFPNPYNNVLVHVDNGADELTGDADPDVLLNQFVASPKNNANSSVTDFFILFGIAGDVDDEANNYARSGMGPIALTAEADFGDAPDSYKTTFEVNGPSHGIDQGLYLGTGVTIENNGKPNNQADGESNSGQDGVSSLPAIQRDHLTNSYTITTSFKNETNSPAHFVAWLDKNGNGEFRQSEAVTFEADASVKSGIATFTWTDINISEPKTFLRIRVSTEVMNESDFGGAFIDGEVEDYRIEVPDGPLPVTLISFAGKESDKSITLNWNTANERDFSHFDILKSADAKEFTSIGAIDGSSRGHYEFKDTAPVNGNNYYRLKMVDTDGSFDLSRVVRVNYETNKTFMVVENPTKGGVFSVNTNAVEPDFELFTTTGSRVGVESRYAEAEHYTLKVKKPGAGLYILKMMSEGKSLTRKIIIP